MKTNIHLWSHLAQFCLEWEMLHTRVVEKIKTHILCGVTIFENPAVYEIMWKYTVQPDGPQMTTWHIHIYIHTHTHTSHDIRYGKNKHNNTEQVHHWSKRTHYSNVPIPVAGRSKAWVGGRSLAVILNSNPAGGTDVFLLWVLFVVR